MDQPLQILLDAMIGDARCKLVTEVLANAGMSVPEVFQRKADGRIATGSIRLPPPISCWDFSGRDLPADEKKK